MANHDGIMVCPVVPKNHATQPRLPVTLEQEEDQRIGRSKNYAECNPRQNLNPQQLFQSMDESQPEINVSEEDEFWLAIGNLKTMFFGISMWCMGWNLVAAFVAPQSCWQFVPALFLGLMLSVSGCHTHRISSSRRYKSLFSFIPFCFVYIMSGLSIMQRSVASALESISNRLRIRQLRSMGRIDRWEEVVEYEAYSDDLTEFTYNGKPETFMCIGNFMLMCFVCYCNVFALKLIFERLGTWFDEVDKTDKKSAESRC